jgi:hypothetical protein
MEDPLHAEHDLRERRAARIEGHKGARDVIEPVQEREGARKRFDGGERGPAWSGRPRL